MLVSEAPFDLGANLVLNHIIGLGLPLLLITKRGVFGFLLFVSVNANQLRFGIFQFSIYSVQCTIYAGLLTLRIFRGLPGPLG